MVAEEEIDLIATHAELMEIERQIEAATAKHNAFLKELGAPPPAGRKEIERITDETAQS